MKRKWGNMPFFPKGKKQNATEKKISKRQRDDLFNFGVQFELD